MSAQHAFSATLAIFLCGVAGSVQAQADAALPEGVTLSMVSAGGSVFKGSGMCTVCHGIDAKGGVGPNLTDGTWIHSKGSYSEIVQQITTGVPTKQSKTGIPMPPKGGSGISEAQVKDVAAYVWTLSHPAPK